MGYIIPPTVDPSGPELDYLMNARSPYHADVVVRIEVDDLALEQLLMFGFKLDIVCWFYILPVLQLSRYSTDLLVERSLI